MLLLTSEQRHDIADVQSGYTEPWNILTSLTSHDQMLLLEFQLRYGYVPMVYYRAFQILIQRCVPSGKLHFCVEIGLHYFFRRDVIVFYDFRLLAFMNMELTMPMTMVLMKSWWSHFLYTAWLHAEVFTFFVEPACGKAIHSCYYCA